MTVCLYQYNLDFWLEGQLFFIIQICRGRNVWSWWLALLYVACKRIRGLHSVQFKIHIHCLRKGQLLFSKNHSASPKNVSEADIINKRLIDNTFDMFDWSVFFNRQSCAFLFERVDFIARIYPIDLEMKDTTDTASPASYLDLHHLYVVTFQQPLQSMYIYLRWSDITEFAVHIMMSLIDGCC